ncbi:uncharacterized protein Nmag_0389 [Natrialba magadii ATCC 43099]|nr:uncharacterized protein Nmag_0389 [Natrialba magadii ATCC 43099]
MLILVRNVIGFEQILILAFELTMIIAGVVGLVYF